MNKGRYKAAGSEAKFEPGSRGKVLRNRLGITQVSEMEQTESAALVDAQQWAVDRFDAEHRFASADIKLLHRQWLGEIYDWAGEYRSVNVSKGDFMFAAAAQVPRLMANFEWQELADCTPCKDMAAAELIKALARSHAELILIHPFLEGNGRCARLLCWLMAFQAGLPALDFSPLAGRGKAAYIAAVRSALDCDYAPMENCFRRVIVQTRKTCDGPA